MYRSFAFSVSFLFLATLPVYAQSSAQKAAVAALVAAERSQAMFF